MLRHMYIHSKGTSMCVGQNHQIQDTSSLAGGGEEGKEKNRGRFDCIVKFCCLSGMTGAQM